MANMLLMYLVNVKYYIIKYLAAIASEILRKIIFYLIFTSCR